MLGMLETLALETLRDELENGTLPARIRALRAGCAAEQAVGRALGVDLAFLRRHPDALFACLWARLAWTEALASVLVRWRAAQSAPWLRSLHAPDPALANALVAELRLDPPVDPRYPPSLLGFAQHTGELVLRDPGTASAQRWNLTTGELVADAAPEVVALPGQAITVGPDHPALQAVLQHSSAPSDADPTYGAVSDDGALVAIVFVDGDELGRLQLYRAATGERVFDLWPCSTHVGIRFCGPQLLLVTGHNETQIIDSPRGQLVLRARQAVQSPGGTIATLDDTGSVVRVWDPAAFGDAIQSDAWPPVFSPDGRRAVVSGELCDGETGRVIATLGATDRGVYLEGGPTHHWFWCGTRYLVSLDDSARWDTETGEHSPLAKLGAMSQSVVGGWDRAGEHRVFARRGERLLTVQDAATGATVAKLQSTASITACALSADATWAVSGSKDGSVELFQCATEQRRLLHRHSGPVTLVAFVERAGHPVAVSACANGSLVAHSLDGRLVREQPVSEVTGASDLLSSEHTNVYLWYARLALALRWAGEPAPVAAGLECGSHLAATLDAHTARLPIDGWVVAHPRAPIWAGAHGHFQWEPGR